MRLRQIQEAEVNREEYEEAVRRRAIEKEQALKRAKKKKKSAKRKKRFSQSQEHMPSEEEVPTMLEELDSEVDGVCSAGMVAQVDIHPHLECGISSEIHRPSEEEGSSMLEELDSEVMEDGVCSAGMVAQVDIHPHLECGNSSEIHRPSEEEGSITSEMDSGMHGEELPDWMSQLFEELDSEVDGVCSTGKVAQVDICPLLECSISSEIHRPLEEEGSSMAEMDSGMHGEELPDWMSQLAEMDSGMHGEELPDWMSQLFEKLDLEVNEDNVCSTGNVTEIEAHPVAEKVISSRIQMPTKLKDLSIANTDVSGFQWWSVDGSGWDHDVILDWIVDMLKRGGHDDLLSQFDLDQEAVRHDVEDELSDLEEDDDSHMSVKTLSNKHILEKGIKWMSEECFLAFTESAEREHFKGIEHKFGELRRQCLNIEAYDKIFHHYNFTIEAKHGSSDIWSSKLYFAEVKQLFGLKSYFCCQLEDADDGRCYGCQNMKCDLQHPRRGGYEEGNADIYWPFIDETDSSSDDDCGCSC